MNKETVSVDMTEESANSGGQAAVAAVGTTLVMLTSADASDAIGVCSPDGVCD